MTSSLPVLVRVSLCCALLALAACESPDPIARMDEFAERTDSQPIDESDAGADISTDIDDACPPVDPTGTWFFALSATLDREAPIFFEITFSIDDEGILQASGQPLRYDADPVDGTPAENPRVAVGEPVLSSSPYGADGTYSLTFPDVTVTGEANPLTGRDILGTVILDGRFEGENTTFGAMSGEIVEPLVLNLNGSTYAGVRAAPEDYPDIDPVYYNDTIPFTPWDCGNGAGQDTRDGSGGGGGSGEGSGVGEGSGS